jgi:hypothetical protein
MNDGRPAGDGASEPLRLPTETDAAVSRWMRHHGWEAASTGYRELGPGRGFYAWEESKPESVRAHGLWIAESMGRQLPAAELLVVLEREGVAREIRINFRVRIEERGAEYRIALVPRHSGRV